MIRCLVCEQEPENTIEIPGFGVACDPGCAEHLRGSVLSVLSSLPIDRAMYEVLSDSLRSDSQFHRIAAARVIAVQDAAQAAALN